MDKAKGADWSVLNEIAKAGERGMTVNDVLRVFVGPAVSASARHNVNVVMSRLAKRGWIAGTGIATFYVTDDGHRALGE